MSRCNRDDIRALLPAHLDGDLDPADAARVREHLEGCPSCREEFETLRLAIDAFRRLPELPPPASILAGVRERLHPVPWHRRVFARRPWLAGVPVGALATVLVVIGIALFQARYPELPQIAEQGPARQPGVTGEVPQSAPRPQVPPPSPPLPQPSSAPGGAVAPRTGRPPALPVMPAPKPAPKPAPEPAPKPAVDTAVGTTSRPAPPLEREETPPPPPAPAPAPLTMQAPASRSVTAPRPAPAAPRIAPAPDERRPLPTARMQEATPPPTRTMVPPSVYQREQPLESSERAPRSLAPAPSRDRSGQLRSIIEALVPDVAGDKAARPERQPETVETVTVLLAPGEELEEIGQLVRRDGGRAVETRVLEPRARSEAFEPFRAQAGMHREISRGWELTVRMPRNAVAGFLEALERRPGRLVLERRTAPAAPRVRAADVQTLHITVLR